MSIFYTSTMTPQTLPTGTLFLKIRLFLLSVNRYPVIPVSSLPFSAHDFIFFFFLFLRFYNFTFLSSHFSEVLRRSASALCIILLNHFWLEPANMLLNPWQVSPPTFVLVLLPVLTATVATTKWVTLASYPSCPFRMQCRNNVSLDFTPGLLIAALLLNLFSDMLLAFYRHYTYFLESLHDSSVSHWHQMEVTSASLLVQK